MKLQESGENYLETILILKRENGVVRSVDVAQRLGFTKPSISRAMALLRGSGYITMAGGMIEMTEIGRETADQIYERHTLLTEFLRELGVTPEIAAQDACRIEHVISDETLDCIRKKITQI